ncbi:MAG: O-unit flippase-like protein [Bacteroides xylanisolvens]
MEIRVSKKDIVWGYISIFFQMTSGIIVLPFILRMLSSEEIGYNYLMLTIGSMIALFDAGFSPMFGKNITYLFSGAQELKKEGVAESHSEVLNYHLIATMLEVAKMVYRRLSVLVLLLMLTIGTIYIYYVTDGFSSVKHSLAIWCVYSFSTFFNLYFAYFNALLTGTGQIKEEKKAIILSRIGYIVISIILLFCGMGLMSICIANLVSPFLGRYVSYKYFFTKELLEQLSGQTVTKEDKHNTFFILWYNVKKLSISMIGGYCIFRVGMLFAGFYLSLEEVASYGLMMQLSGIITSVSQNYYIVKQPEIASYKVRGDKNKLTEIFSFSIISFLLMVTIGLLFVVFCGPLVLNLIHSNTYLPSQGVMLLYSLVVILEANHSLCGLMILADNRVVPIAASIIPGFFIMLFSYLFLKYTQMGVLGLVIAQGTCQLAYNNWKWPMVVMKDLEITPYYIIKTGFSQITNKIYKLATYVRY